MRCSTERHRLPWAATALTVVVVVVMASCSTDDGGAGSTSPTAATTTEATSQTTSTTSTTSTTEPATTEPATTEPATTEPATTQPATTTTTPPCPVLTAGVNDITLTAGGADHPVRVFVPSSFGGQRLPTVLNWHGLGSDGPQQAALSGYETLAEMEGFIVVHPTGVPAPGTTSNSWELVDVQDSVRDDLAFANALIDLLVANWCADPSRIYSTGMSNGGFFTARLVCEAADRIAAAASVAGTTHPEGCAPARAVPYLAFHGTADTYVPFDGDGQSVLLGGAIDPARREFFEQVMPEEFAEFAADADCAADPASTAVGTDVTRYDYSDCADGVPMAFFEVAGGGHTWPGSPIGDALEGLLGYATQDVSATVDGWAFFEQHALER